MSNCITRFIVLSVIFFWGGGNYNITIQNLSEKEKTEVHHRRDIKSGRSFKQKGSVDHETSRSASVGRYGRKNIVGSWVRFRM